MSYEGNVKQPTRIRVPFMRRGRQIGAGDVVKKATSTLGIQPCGGCKKRAVWLNGRLVFVGTRGE